MTALGAGQEEERFLDVGREERAFVEHAPELERQCHQPSDAWDARRRLDCALAVSEFDAAVAPVE